MKIRMLGLLILNLCLISTISPISAGIYDTYVTMDPSYTVHHGDNVTVKVELFSKEGGFLGSDGWLEHGRLFYSVIAKNKNDAIIWVMRDEFKTNMWGNGYFTINTSGLEPGQYALEVDVPRSYSTEGDIFLSSEGSAGLLVT